MTSVWRRLQLRIAGTTPARRFQEEADVGVAAVLSCFRSLKLDPQNDNKEHEELFDQAVEIVGSKKFEQQKQYVQDEVAKQVQSCFEAVLKMPKDSEKSAPKMSLSGFERNNEVEEKLGITDNFQKLFGFTLNVEESSVPGAGEGVKLRGSAPIGSLVALYPGIVYLPEHYKKKHHLSELTNNPYARARFDSVIIDAKKECKISLLTLTSSYSIANDSSSLSQHRTQETRLLLRTKSTILPAEHLRTCLASPLSSLPKLLQTQFMLTVLLLLLFCLEPFTTKEYDELIPNNFVQEPSRLSMFGKRAIVHVCNWSANILLLLNDADHTDNFIYTISKQGLAFIATADIADEEELFLNYRYNPDRPMPEWYAPVDVDSDRAMWK
ncbi:hypothetical protein AM587_10012752 [Phytophthora nicotianae]|uniref:SET domain-containing protein n=1 Tax=Phytophthora nicotianae TaxID=4792 RepID=A0A0W8BWC3_PHYNI|nr:hypothetical protein AM587_10012752 [Phytophthora nicotianae]